MKKTLFVAAYFPPMIGGAAFRTCRFAEAIARAGYETHVLSIRNKKDAGFETGKFEISPKILMHETFSLELSAIGLGLLGLFGKNGARYGSARRLYYWATPCRHIGWLPFAFLGGMKQALDQETRFIYAAYPVPTNLFVALALKWLGRKKLVIDMHDRWHSVVKDYVPTKLHEKALALIEGFVLRRADWVWVATESIGEEARKFGVPEEKIILMEHTIDFEKIGKIRPSEDVKTYGRRGVGKPGLTATAVNRALLSQQAQSAQNEMQAKRGSSSVSPHGRREDAKTLVYAGTLTEDQDMECTVKALNLLQDEGMKAQLLIVGPDNRAMLDRLNAADAHGLVKYLGKMDYESSIALMKAADALVLPLAREDRLAYALPSKIMEYTACGPIIAHVPEGEAAGFVRKNGIGMAYTGKSAPELKDKLLLFFRNKKFIAEFSGNAQAVARKHDTAGAIAMAIERMGF